MKKRSPDPGMLYGPQVDEAMTGFLFGEEPNLDPLPLNYPKAKCYVDKRICATGGYHQERYHAEEELLLRFWPPGGRVQMLHLVGGAGSGKSTFARFFFQYFVPHYQTLVRGAAEGSTVQAIHGEHYQQHIVLYLDLRRYHRSADLASYLYNLLGMSLAQVSRRLNLPLDPGAGGNYTEDWVRRNVCRVARETQENRRKWYISWVLDNSDQMDEASQLDLGKVILDDWVRQEPSPVLSCEPVLEGQHRDLWRIIIPIRPETQTNLTPAWDPIPNRESIDLDPIDPDLLVTQRSAFLLDAVAASTRHPFVDLFDSNIHRAEFDMIIPEEQAPSLRNELLAAHQLEHQVPSGVRCLVDQLVGDSARRRLILLRTVAFSSVFRERLATDELSPFYFFDGLIRGNCDVFRPGNGQLILNLYNMGASPTSAPHSIFVGLYAMYLLGEGMEWADVKTALSSIGWADKELTACEGWLVGKELIKPLWRGGYRIESSIVKGHWALLKERAYTDNMVVPCAISWKVPAHPPQTDPLNPEDLLRRFAGSLWFMKKVWGVEQLLPCYNHDDPGTRDRCGEFHEFSLNRRKLRLPSFTHYVAEEYLRRISKMREWAKPDRAIRGAEEQWFESLQALQDLVTESGRQEALYPRQS